MNPTKEEKSSPLLSKALRTLFIETLLDAKNNVVRKPSRLPFSWLLKDTFFGKYN